MKSAHCREGIQERLKCQRGFKPYDPFDAVNDIVPPCSKQCTSLKITDLLCILW